MIPTILHRTEKRVKIARKWSDQVPMDRRRLLKVKLKALAAEAAIIRKEEASTRSIILYRELHEHRVRQLRAHARDAHIAYGLIRGHAYEQIEQPPKKFPLMARPGPNWMEIERMVRKYGTHGSPAHKFVIDKIKVVPVAPSPSREVNAGAG